MDNVTATLNLPKGLSLADMQEGKTNTKTVNMGKINPGDSVSKHWYVRGDEDGIYNFDVSVDVYKRQAYMIQFIYIKLKERKYNERY